MECIARKVYRGRKFTTVEPLKLATIDECRNLGQHSIDCNFANEWRQRF